MWTKICGQEWFAVTVGWQMILGSYFGWTYLSYDVLLSVNRAWFYRVNALLHEHPEPGVATDPLFWLASILGNLLIFGLPLVALFQIFRVRFGPRIVILTAGIALALSLFSKFLLFLSPTTIEMKTAAAGDFLIGAGIVTLSLWFCRRRVKKLPTDSTLNKHEG